MGRKAGNDARNSRTAARLNPSESVPPTELSSEDREIADNVGVFPFANLMAQFSDFSDRLMSALLGQGIRPEQIERIRPLGGGRYLIVNGGTKHYLQA